MFHMKKINFQSTFATAHFSMMLFPRLHSFRFQIKKKLNFSSLNSWEMKWQRYPAFAHVAVISIYLLWASTGCEIYFTKKEINSFSLDGWKRPQWSKQQRDFRFVRHLLCSIVEFFQLIQKLQLLSLTAKKKVEIVWSLGKFYIERIWGHKNSLFQNLILFQHIFRVDSFIILFAISELVPYKLQLFFLLLCLPHPSACFLYDKLNFNI